MRSKVRWHMSSGAGMLAFAPFLYFRSAQLDHAAEGAIMCLTCFAIGFYKLWFAWIFVGMMREPNPTSTSCKITRGKRSE